MTNLTLKNLDVKELRKQEQVEVVGGMKFWKAVLGFLVCLGIGALAGWTN